MYDSKRYQDPSNKAINNEFKNSFNSLPTPTSDLDWLANYKERGQSYSQFLNQCPLLDDNHFSDKFIYLTFL